MADKFTGLKPEFVPVVKKILAELTKLGWQPIIAEGIRTVAQQREKVRKGYSQTMHSKHILGQAVDIVDKRYLWNVDIIHKFWLDLGHIARDNGMGWGGVWLQGKNRFPIYEKAVKEHRVGLITWFCDVAHVEWRDNA